MWDIRHPEDAPLVELWRWDGADWRLAGYFPSVAAAQGYIDETAWIEQQIDQLVASLPSKEP